MIYYGLGIVASVLFGMFWSQKKIRPSAVVFLLALFFFVLGFYGRRSEPLEARVVRLVNALFLIAPYVLGLFSAAVVVHSLAPLKRRGWSRKYGMLLVVGTGTLLMVGAVFLNKMLWQLPLLFTLEFLMDYSFLYLIFVFVAFIFLLLVNHFDRPDLKKDYIIILGIGLTSKGTISKLLKYRLDEALRFYQKQKEEGERQSLLIVSGGKGPDDDLSEAEAMKDYLLKNGVAATQILVENESVNTHQNFLYSKRIMKESATSNGSVFITNNFHVLRSGLYARQLGIGAEGIGARTPLKYMPYALAREYLALLLIYRHFHITTGALFLLAMFMLFR